MSLDRVARVFEHPSFRERYDVADRIGSGSTLALPESDAPEVRRKVQAARQWFERNDGWLLVLDNAPRTHGILLGLGAPCILHEVCVQTARITFQEARCSEGCCMARAVLQWHAHRLRHVCAAGVLVRREHHHTASSGMGCVVSLATASGLRRVWPARRVRRPDVDLVSLALVGIFFALSWGFVVLCERL
jgi:hypothetical protein